MDNNIIKYGEEYELDVLEARKRLNDGHIDVTEYSEEVIKCLKKYQKNIGFLTHE